MSNDWYRQYRKDYYYKRKAEYIALLGGFCVKCNSVDDLEFDHIDRTTKSFTITNFADVSKASALEELKKCQLL